jgi:15-cis-phytoene synthase
MDSYQIAAETVREQDRDRYFADLFVPEPKRRHVLALHAFNAEIVRIRDMVTEPPLGEIRQEWWRQALTGEGTGEGSPIAEAVLATMSEFRLPPAPFEALISARTFDLYNDPMPSVADLEGYAGETSSALFQLAAMILADGSDPGSADAAGHAGVAQTLAAALLRLPMDARRKQLFLPLDVLQRHGVGLEEVFAGGSSPALEAALAELRSIAVRHLRQALELIPALAPEVRAAFLPVALAGADLERLEGGAADPLTPLPPMATWRRQWILWRTARKWRRQAGPTRPQPSSRAS